MNDERLLQALDRLIGYLEESVKLLKELRSNLIDRSDIDRANNALTRSYMVDRSRILTYSFKIHNDDVMNKGPLAWFRRRLEEEESKGHIKLKRSYRGDEVVFEIELLPQASKDDREKIDRWASWVARRLER